MTSRTNRAPVPLRTTITTIILLLASLSSVTGQVDDIKHLDLESLINIVVTSASRHEQSLKDSPANVFVISREMIEMYGCLSIGEALSLVPGIYVTDDYSLSQVGVRGVSLAGDWNSRVMVLLDGRPVVEQYGGSGSIDVTGVDIDNIDHIEVIKGPSSSLYGSNAFFGLVNLVSSEPDQNSLTSSSRYYSGTNLYSTGYQLSHSFGNDVSLMSSATILDRRGADLFFEEFSDLGDGSLLTLDDDGYNQYYLDSSDFTGGYSQNRNTLERISSYSRLEWRQFHVSAQFTRQNTGISHGFYGAVFNRPENQYRERRHFVEVGYDGALGATADISLRSSYNYYTWSDHILYNYWSEEDEADYLPGPIWMDAEFNRSFASEARLRLDMGENNTAIIGAEAQFHKIRHESGETDISGESIPENVIPAENVEHNGQVYNLYIQNEHRISDKLQAVGGLHFNYFSYSSGKVMPKGAVIFTPYSRGTYKLIASRGFRSPTLYETTFDDGDYIVSNPDLVPELITSYEFIVAHSFPWGFASEIAMNFSRMQDLIVQTVVDIDDPAHPGGDYLDEVGQFRNIGEMESRSIEASVTRDPIYGIGGFANLTYQKLEITNDGEDLSSYNSPEWLANAGVSVRLIDSKLYGSVKANYVSSRRMWNGNWLSDQWTADINFSLKRAPGGIDASLGVKNLLGEDARVPLSWDYTPSSSIERPGRSVYLRLQKSFSW